VREDLASRQKLGDEKAGNMELEYQKFDRPLHDLA
jgi:hypothetical protein